jgi:anti-sigma B factor antagonist
MSIKPAAVPPPVLQIHTSTAEGATVVRCVGHLTFDVSANFKADIKALIPQTKRLVLDLTDLAYLDSAGLGAIVSIYVSARKAGCGMQLINLNRRVKELLGITHLLSVFAACSEYNVKMP